MMNKPFEPWPLSRVEDPNGTVPASVDNRLPPGLRAKGLGLAVFCAKLEELGQRITTVYRSRELTEYVYAHLDPPRPVPYAGPGAHGQADAIDLGGKYGKDDAESFARMNAAVDQAAAELGVRIKRRIGSPSHSSHDDHLHVELYGDELEALGRAWHSEGNA